MRKSLHVLCLALLMMSFVSQSYAQRKRSELAVGYGYFSLFSFANHSMNDAPFNTSSGTTNVTYRYYLTRNFTLGMGVGYESISTWGNFVTIAPEVTFCYLDTRDHYIRVRLYGSASYGVSLISDNDIPNNEADESGAKPWGFHAVPFGMRVGRQFAGFVEVGVGYKGLIHGGLELRWPQVVGHKHKHCEENDQDEDRDHEYDHDHDNNHDR
jgi:hypothetical protein